MTPEELADTAATVIIGDNVRPDCEKAFLSWQYDLNTAASHYPGFIAAEISSPASVQPQVKQLLRRGRRTPLLDCPPRPKTVC